MTDIKPMIQQYIALVGEVYPGRIPFGNPNRLQAEKLHDQVRGIEIAHFGYSNVSWQQHMDSVKETV